VLVELSDIRPMSVRAFSHAFQTSEINQHLSKLMVEKKNSSLVGSRLAISWKDNGHYFLSLGSSLGPWPDTVSSEETKARFRLRINNTTTKIPVTEKRNERTYIGLSSNTHPKVVSLRLKCFLHC
jgi:hypothetical protein